VVSIRRYPTQARRKSSDMDICFGSEVEGLSTDLTNGIGNGSGDGTVES
jgi:hypothetical protein